jgi:hypothetical protein
MKPVAPITLLFLGRNLNDLARARWERACTADPSGMSFVVLTTDEHTLRDEFYFTPEGAAALIEWRDAYLADQRRKREDEQGATNLHI